MENPQESILRAPLPTNKTLRARKNPMIQLYRFIIINLKMLRMIGKEPH